MGKKAICVLLFALMLSGAVLPTYGLDLPVVAVIDAGHGGEDGGAVSSDGTAESGINLAIAQKLEWILCFLGYETVMTRSDENAVYDADAATLREKKVSDLKNRVALVNDTTGGLLISIHQNSLPSHPRVHGAQVFYNGAEDSADVARAVQDALNCAINGGNEKNVAPTGSGIYLMKNSQKPSILVECGFMSNETECRKLKDAAYQVRLAAAIGAGVSSYTTQQRTRSVVNEE